MVKTVIARRFLKNPNHTKYIYYFKKSGFLYKQQRGKLASGQTYRATRTALRIPGGWRSGHFYTINLQGHLIESVNAPLFR